MTKEDIEKAAVDSCIFENSIFNPELTPYYEQGFKDGAKWRINSVWHNVSEYPDENEPAIIERGEGIYFLHEKGYKGPWKYNVEQFGFKRWAYMKDLIPNTEERQIKKNGEQDSNLHLH